MWIDFQEARDTMVATVVNLLLRSAYLLASIFFLSDSDGSNVLIHDLKCTFLPQINWAGYKILRIDLKV